MDEQERFEANRPRLRAVAHRMLGSAAEAEDAVQEAWLRLHRTGTGQIDNLDAWLTTVVGRVCLDMLRSRVSRRENGYEAEPPAAEPTAVTGPEQEVLLADSVGLALLVVLETLTPTERLAFVLHDLFAVSFDEIAPIVGRSPDAARQLASRARRRVRAHPDGIAETPADRRIVEAFLAASRGGDLRTLLTLLDPDVEVRVDGVARLQGRERVAHYFDGKARSACPALVDGTIGILVARDGRTIAVIRVTVAGGLITDLDTLMDAARYADLEVVPLRSEG